MTARPVRFRRSPSLVAYWTSRGITFHNFATGVAVRADALTIGLLDHFSTWKTADALVRQSTLPAAKVSTAIDSLVERSLLLRSDRDPPGAERAMDAWRSWNPAAGFFHFSTKDVRFATVEGGRNWLARRAEERPSPTHVRLANEQESIRLPAGHVAGSLRSALLKRRTWRRFAGSPVSVPQLAALLDFTFAVRHVVDLGQAGTAMLRTSPSAGARNPLECYALIRQVDGVPRGIYHYSPEGHALVRRAPLVRRFGSYLPGQPWYSKAALLVVITAVVERTEWKYPFARAYRTLLLEAGHFAQTFCLVATALGLAPFCTAALADSTIENDLGIDGVSEATIYVCGVGTRPNLEWAPWPDGRSVPRLRPARPARHPRKR